MQIPPRCKFIFFSLLPAAAVVLLLALTELALRALWPSLAAPLVTVVTLEDGNEYYQVNRRYLDRYFPAGSPMIPDLKPSTFRRNKDRSTFRIFCVGESSMAGTPYELSATIPALLRKQLRHLEPTMQIEVVNFGAAAVNTNVVADLMPHLLALEPDLILLYAGHNEFYGPDGAGASWIERIFPALTRFKYSARGLALVRLLQHAFAGPDPRAGERNLMKQVSQGMHVELGSAIAQRIFDRYRENLRRMFRETRRAGVPVIASDVASNLSFPPFAYTEEEGFDSLPSLFASGRYGDLRARLDAFRSRDSTNAFIEYWSGRTAQATGNPGRAAALLRRARDYDLLKFRAPETMNVILRQVCAAEGVPCLAADSLLCASSPGGITDSTLFCEHLHPNVRGYDQIARLFARAILHEHLLPDPEGRSLLPLDPDSLSIAWLDLAFADLSLRNLTQHWPFTASRWTMTSFDTADAPRREIAIALYNRKVGWDEASSLFVDYAIRTGRYPDAIRTLSALLEEHPERYPARYTLADVWKMAGHPGRALGEYGRVIASRRDYAPGYVEAGLLENNMGEFDTAEAHLREALRLTEHQDVPALRGRIYYGLAATVANRGHVADAKRLIGESLRLLPSFQPGLQLRRQLDSAR
ncbi:MAG TPA: tetratricopeptide repeat protein [Bacteroidota bacterium]|nr:tetratricopeptide repeat protein [Bacteroidota bacterium]